VTRILLVEDSAMNAEMTRGVLETQAYEVTVAEDGRRAVELFVDGSFALVLMDVHLPVIDGLEATRRLRALEAKERRRRTSIVALTSSACEADVRACIRAGMDAHLTKPVDANRLLSVVAALARR
jgi:CheY-like chemotaxis protein